MGNFFSLDACSSLMCLSTKWVLQNHGNLTLGYMHEIICHVLQSYLCDSKTGRDLTM